jgi:hypothetical protein
MTIMQRQLDQRILSTTKFPKTVLEQFEFLTQRYGFVCTSRGNIGVRYESDTVFVNIFYDFRDGGLILERKKSLICIMLLN